MRRKSPVNGWRSAGNRHPGTPPWPADGRAECGRFEGSSIRNPNQEERPRTAWPVPGTVRARRSNRRTFGRPELDARAGLVGSRHVLGRLPKRPTRRWCVARARSWFRAARSRLQGAEALDAVRCVGRPLFILRERSSTLAAYRSLFTEEPFVRGNWGGVPGYRAHVARCCRSFAVGSRRLRDGSLAKLYAQCLALGACFTADHSCPSHVGPRIVWFGRRYSTLVWRRLVGCRPRRAPLRDP